MGLRGWYIMTSAEEAGGTPEPRKGDLYSPFLRETMYFEESDFEASPRLELLEEESPLSEAFENISSSVREIEEFKKDLSETEEEESPEFESDLFSPDSESEGAFEELEEEWYERSPGDEAYYALETGEAEKGELFESDLPPELLTWKNATPEQIAFMRKVYLKHISRTKVQGLKFVASVPASQLETIEGRHQARIIAAGEARNLLSAARNELDRQQKEGVPLARQVQSIFVNSGYRDSNRQFTIWQNKFPDYYKETRNERIRAGQKYGGGEHGDAAASVLVKYISGKVAAPGYSRHNDGLAIDFGTKEGNVKIPLSTKIPQVKRWENTWLYNWLINNAARFGFYPLKTEPWHWTYRPPPILKFEEQAPNQIEFKRGRWDSLYATHQVPGGIDCLRAHNGKKLFCGPVLILNWNTLRWMNEPELKIDIVIHLHGNGSEGMNLEDQKEWENTCKDPKGRGLHWFQPPAGAPERQRPTLGFLVRGRSRGNNHFDFPVLSSKAGIGELIEFGFSRLKEIYPPLQKRDLTRDRLILTAHSGGGQPLTDIITNIGDIVDELHIFDALYTNPNNLIKWALSRIDREISNPERPGAFRVLHRGEGTEKYSLDVCSKLKRKLLNHPSLEKRYRVQRTSTPHKSIPYRYGSALLTDAGMDFPNSTYNFILKKTGKNSFDCRPEPIHRHEIETQFFDEETLSQDFERYQDGSQEEFESSEEHPEISEPELDSLDMEAEYPKQTSEFSGFEESPPGELTTPTLQSPVSQATMIFPQECYHLDAEPEQYNWWDTEASLEFLLENAPTELRALLKYLGISYPTFAPIEGQYFNTLTQHLRRNGIIGLTDTLNRTNFQDAIRRFQASKGQTPDGIPGENTLWDLQIEWANNRKLSLHRVEANKVPSSEGLDHFWFREDAAASYNNLRKDVLNAGGVITSAGSFRDLCAVVTAARSATSMHYSGLALDLATDTGMRNTSSNPYLITQEGRKWRVWCRSQTANEQPIDAVLWSNGRIHIERVTAKVFDFTSLCERHGFTSIGSRKTFPSNYLSAEWWHFQYERALTPYISQFGIELLSLAQYNEGILSRNSNIWANRKRIFKRLRRGWY
jgi:LAS superfamily LD-carboxypeptidase LdcB